MGLLFIWSAESDARGRGLNSFDHHHAHVSWIDRGGPDISLFFLISPGWVFFLS